MAATRFEGAGPVARYWLAHCEGFAVRGGADGVVEELIHDGDPHVTTQLVVRTGHRRRKVVSAVAVDAVVPAEKLVLVERTRRQVGRPPLPAPSLARLRPPARGARRAVLRGVRHAARLAQPASAVLIRSLRLLGAEVKASVALVLRKTPP
jgi:hypothetical protein